MDPSAYATVTTARGLKYNYYISRPTASKPVLLFLHGFPSTSYDWRHQINFFKDKGYGLIVPDMLGYGGTDKPTDPTLYAASLICKDIIDILDAEKVDQAIAIGHDWGSKIASRLANYYVDRFTAFAFIAVGYMPPSPGVKFNDVLAFTKQVAGYELFGYWIFFSESDAHRTVEANFDSFYSIIFADDHKLWKSDMAPTGALKSWVESNKKTTSISCISDEEKQIQKKVLLEGGLEAPFCWYRTGTAGVDSEDAKSIPLDNYSITKPVFFGGAKQDYIAVSALAQASVAKFCKGAVTVHEFDAGHWVILEAKDELNQKLLDWLDDLHSQQASN